MRASGNEHTGDVMLRVRFAVNEITTNGDRLCSRTVRTPPCNWPSGSRAGNCGKLWCLAERGLVMAGCRGIRREPQDMRSLVDRCDRHLAPPLETLVGEQPQTIFLPRQEARLDRHRRAAARADHETCQSLRESQACLAITISLVARADDVRQPPPAT